MQNRRWQFRQAGMQTAECRGENKMFKRSLKYITVCLAICCAFLLGKQWKSREMKELLAIKEEQEAEIAGCKREKDEMSSEMKRLLGEKKENEALFRQYEEEIKGLQAEWDWLCDKRRERNNRKEMTADRIVVETNNTYYKMFYGKWRISSVIKGRYFKEYDNYYDEEKAGKYLGRTVEYSCGSIKVDGERALMAPAYAYAIVPADKFAWYVESYSPQEDIIDFTNNNYFIFVKVGTVWKKSDFQEKDIFNSFFIVDDDTMVLAADGIFFWMKRVEHMRDYEVSETFQEYDW